MAQENSARSALDRYRDTSIAFDELIVRVGRALARAQEAMDLGQAEFQRQVALALAEGRMTRLDVNPANAFTIPEIKLELKIGMSLSYPEGGGPPTLSAVPLNAATTNQNDIDVEAATEVKLRFVAVPQTEDPPGPPPSSLTPQSAQDAAAADGRIAPAIKALANATADVDYAEEPRLWTVAYLEAREPGALAVVDDRTGGVIGAVAKNRLPTPEEMEPVGPPRLDRVEPHAARRGEYVTVDGDNFLTLAGQTELTVDGRPIPIARLAMDRLSFKVPSWVTRGDIVVSTPLGTTGEAGAERYTPIPTFESFDPPHGTFDRLSQRGSWFSLIGHNLRHDCRIRFANGVESRNVQVLSPGRMQVEVPEGAESGPLTLVYFQFEQRLIQPFFILPQVERVSPRQAMVGSEIALQGSSLGGVTEVVVGKAVVGQAEFLLQTPQLIRFRVPPGAYDGPIRVREVFGSDRVNEVRTRDIFYVVPKITGFRDTVVSVGALLTLYGEGLDPDPEMMTLLFDARGGFSEAPVLAVAPDRKSITTRVPMDAVTGFVLLLRKRVYSESSQAETSDRSLNKLTVLLLEGHPSDLIFEERFDGELSRWNAEAGEWRIERGMLASPGTARLSLTEPAALRHFPRDAIVVYADVLQAEKFGLSLTPADGGDRLQVWVDLLAATPALTWSTIDSGGRQQVQAGQSLALFPGGNHMLKLVISSRQATFFLDQAEVHTFAVGGFSVAGLALLSDSDTQRWDNVVAMTGDYLSLPQPQFYRFGNIPVEPPRPLLRIDNFSPRKGDTGTEVSLMGDGLDEAARVFFGGAEAEIISAAGSEMTVRVPAGAKSGPLEIHGRGGLIVSTGLDGFVVPPTLLSVLPSPVIAGQELTLAGLNLPTRPESAAVTVLGQTAQVTGAMASMMFVLAPDLAGIGEVALTYEGFTAQAPEPIEVRREAVVTDLIGAADHAVWTAGGDVVNFGARGEWGAGSVQLHPSERLEDDALYGPVLYVHPPSPALGALRGTFPHIQIPAGRVELRLQFGMLWSAAPAPEEAAEADGVIFQVGFELAESSVEFSLLPKTVCVHDGSLERFVIDAQHIAGREGRLVVSVFAGRSGLRDDAAIVEAELVQLT